MTFFISFFFISSIIFGEVSDGYTIFTPYADGESVITYLIDSEDNIIHTWNHLNMPASMPYLYPDSSIIYPYKVNNPTMIAGGVGGGIQNIDWYGNIIWDFQFANDIYQHHHDVEPLPNGNILIVVWEKKTSIEAFQRGRQEINNTINQMWSTAILELEPESGNIVWEWHLWDHLIQDVSPDFPNYGVISEHPELFDINCGEAGANIGGPQGSNGDWMHVNSVDYNENLDQIVISSRSQNEIFIIDHSTTTEQAADHSGRNSGKGGDFLYRWGNPENYDSGNESHQILNAQHGVNWITEGYPGSGNLIIFNNFHDTNHSESAVLEIVTPINESGTYNLALNNIYGPFNFEMEYSNNFTTPLQGGAFRLYNGNTLITQTHTSRIIEVDYYGEIIWDYSFELGDASYWIARAQKYSIDYFDNVVNVLPGDVNNDGIINILDIVSTVNIVLGLADQVDAADFNGDGVINVLDIISIVNAIIY